MFWLVQALSRNSKREEEFSPVQNTPALQVVLQMATRFNLEGRPEMNAT